MGIAFNTRDFLSTAGSILQGSLTGQVAGQQDLYQRQQQQLSQGIALGQIQHQNLMDQLNRQDTSDRDEEAQIPYLAFEDRGPALARLAQRRADRNFQASQSAQNLFGKMAKLPGAQPYAAMFQGQQQPFMGAPSAPQGAPLAPLPPNQPPVGAGPAAPPATAAPPISMAGSMLGAPQQVPTAAGLAPLPPDQPPVGTAAAVPAAPAPEATAAAPQAGAGGTPINMPGMGQVHYTGATPDPRALAARITRVTAQFQNLVGLSPYDQQVIQQNLRVVNQPVRNMEEYMAVSQALSNLELAAMSHGAQASRAETYGATQGAVQHRRMLQDLRDPSTTDASATAQLPQVLDATNALTKEQPGAQIDVGVRKWRPQIEQIRQLSASDKPEDQAEAERLAGQVMIGMRGNLDPRKASEATSTLQRLMSQSTPEYLQTHPDYVRTLYHTAGLDGLLQNMSPEDLASIGSSGNLKQFNTLMGQMKDFAKMPKEDQAPFLEMLGRTASALGIRAPIPAEIVEKMTPDAQARMAHWKNLDIQGDKRLDIEAGKLAVAQGQLKNAQNTHAWQVWAKQHAPDRAALTAARGAADHAFTTYRGAMSPKPDTMQALALMGGWNPEDTTKFPPAKDTPDQANIRRAYQDYQTKENAYQSAAKSSGAPLSGIEYKDPDTPAPQPPTTGQRTDMSGYPTAGQPSTPTPAPRTPRGTVPTAGAVGGQSRQGRPTADQRSAFSALKADPRAKNMTDAQIWAVVLKHGQGR